jgi:hypothetical protein
VKLQRKQNGHIEIQHKQTIEQTTLDMKTVNESDVYIHEHEHEHAHSKQSIESDWKKCSRQLHELQQRLLYSQLYSSLQSEAYSYLHEKNSNVQRNWFVSEVFDTHITIQSTGEQTIMISFNKVKSMGDLHLI